MEQNSRVNRLHALDGLRGLAIIMVFLSHINATFINRSNLLGSYIFDSGVIGVTFLFILSGFLMAYLYPQPKNKLAFIQKRYTRIFPLFLTMCTTLFILRLFSINQWYISLIILLITACIAHVIWVFGVKRYFTANITKVLFSLFIAVQIIAGILYLWVMHHPATFYYSQLSMLERAGINYLVNATLVLPIGRYVEPFDPVYWSLTAEILFYLLYPFICAPLIAYMSQKSKVEKILLLICLLPLFVSIAMLFQHILFLSLLRFQLFIYFAGGMTLGYLYRKNPKAVSNIGKFFPKCVSYATILLFFGLILFEQIITANYFSQMIWIQILFAIPLTLLLAISLSNTTALAKFFRSKILVFIGTISYSIYLSHMLVLNLMIHIIKQPTTVASTSVYIFLTFIVTIILSSILYFLLERPYFKRTYIEKKTTVFRYEPNPAMATFLGGTSLGLLLTIFVVYQSDLTFFTLRVPYDNSIISPKKQTEFISLKEYHTVTMQITAAYDNFGVITLHLIHDSLPNKKFIPQRYIFQMKEKRAKNWYATSQFYIRDITDVLPVSFGFPLIANAAGKTYIVSISQLIPNSSEYIVLDSEKNTIGGIFFVNKKTVVTHPAQLLTLIENKFSTVINTNEAQQEFNLAIPFMLFSIYIFVTNMQNLQFKNPKKDNKLFAYLYRKQKRRR